MYTIIDLWSELANISEPPDPVTRVELDSMTD